jgi:hypothetical protein
MWAALHGAGTARLLTAVNKYQGLTIMDNWAFIIDDNLFENEYVSH